MRFVDLTTVVQVVIAIFYIVAIVLEIGCVIIDFINRNEKDHRALFMSLIVISSIQIFMMIEIFYEKEWKVPVTGFTAVSAEQSIFFSVSLLGSMLGASMFYIVGNYRRYKREISFNSIKEAFDDLPKAISIINQKGIPVLVNKQMYELVYIVTGKDFQSMDDIVGILNKNAGYKGVTFIGSEEDSIVLKTPDKRVWRIDQKTFDLDGDVYREISANEITQIYELSNRLREKNLDLIEQKKRQEKLLKDIIQSKKEEEILNLKIDTHSKFGKAILATQLFLSDQNEKSPIDIWQDVIKKTQMLEEEDENSNSSLNQLIDASSVFGCRIVLEGELPKDDKTSYLIVTAMREAITNAVRHSKADEVRINITTTDSLVKVEIEDNSNTKIRSIKETGGLADLRKKIEKSGGDLRVVCQACVKLVIVLPVNKA